MLTGPKIPFFNVKNLSVTSAKVSLDSSGVSQSLPCNQQLEG